MSFEVSLTIEYGGAFFEFLPSPPVKCSNLGFVNDNMRADVLNHAANGGPLNQWDIIVTDLTNGLACNATNHTFSLSGDGKPYYADFIDERVSAFGSLEPLPAFSTANMVGNR